MTRTRAEMTPLAGPMGTRPVGDRFVPMSKVDLRLSCGANGNAPLSYASIGIPNRSVRTPTQSAGPFRARQSAARLTTRSQFRSLSPQPEGRAVPSHSSMEGKMRTSCSPGRKGFVARCAGSALALVLAASTAAAQTGVVSGSVTEASTGRALGWPLWLSRSGSERMYSGSSCTGLSSSPALIQLQLPTSLAQKRSDALQRLSRRFIAERTARLLAGEKIAIMTTAEREAPSAWRSRGPEKG